MQCILKAIPLTWYSSRKGLQSGR